jgi:hypothetical protein
MRIGGRLACRDFSDGGARGWAASYPQTLTFASPPLHRSSLRGILGPYERHKAEFEPPTRVYRIDGQTGKTTIITEAPVRRPNGIGSSPDFSKVKPGFSDGVRCDSDGTCGVAGVGVA